MNGMGDRTPLEETYRRNRLRAKRSAIRLLVMTLLAALFIKGMPLHFLFHPWGQFTLVLWVPICGWSLMDCTTYITESFDRRKLSAIGGRRV